MKTYEIFTTSSEGFNPLHTVQAASVEITNGFYVFYDDSVNKRILHAIATAPGLFVRTVDK